MEAYVAVGANLGNRVSSIESALTLLASLHYIRSDFIATSITQTSALYETEAAYVDSGPKYLNCVVQISLQRQPCGCLDANVCAAACLLWECLWVEQQLGRSRLDTLHRNMPRVVDLDLIALFVDGESLSVDVEAWSGCPSAPRTRKCDLFPLSLQLPHPRFAERLFVVQPLVDIDASLRIIKDFTVNSLLIRLKSATAEEYPTACLSTPRPQLVVGHSTLWPLSGLVSDLKIFGILNITPDSFSDGGTFWDARLDNLNGPTGLEEEYVAKQMAHIQTLVAAGCEGIDIGAESTRPFAQPIPPSVQIHRLRGIMQYLGNIPSILWPTEFSLDTKSSAVFEWAFTRNPGLMLNDTSGLSHDPLMLQTAQERRCTCIIMHNRGNPETMNALADYDDLVTEVAEELNERINDALRHGIFRWRIMADPGIGFAKLGEANVLLLEHLHELRSKLPNGIFFMLGISRKRFLRQLNNEGFFCDTQDPDAMVSHEESEWRAAALLKRIRVHESCVCLRVHNPERFKQTLFALPPPPLRGDA